eukprot:COSAG02_NODE_492_length_21210_cov_13.381176_6_plen_44_part_00
MSCSPGSRMVAATTKISRGPEDAEDYLMVTCIVIATIKLSSIH